MTNKEIVKTLFPNRNIMRLVLLLSVIPIFLTAQTSVCSNTQVYGYSPAPCSIEANTVTTDRYVIRVGVYSRYIRSYQDVVVIPINGYYHYYYAPQGRLLLSLQEGHNIISNLNYDNRFCDAILVKNPFNARGYEQRNY